MTGTAQKLADTVLISGLRVTTRIGIEDWERKVDQELILDLRLQPKAGFSAAAESDAIDDALDYAKVSDCLVEWARQSDFQLIEALASHLLDRLFQQFPMIAQIRLLMKKPGVVPAADWVGLEMERSA